ncbi:MAG: hypothetical protein M1828_004050 [Chrysothrix sp. TS-e1954]|nr:MAG: hypothetical protein M1828_004050 [Chrysothrix sp. TS-e1954]
MPTSKVEIRDGQENVQIYDDWATETPAGRSEVLEQPSPEPYAKCRTFFSGWAPAVVLFELESFTRDSYVAWWDEMRPVTPKSPLAQRRGKSPRRINEGLPPALRPSSVQRPVLNRAPVSEPIIRGSDGRGESRSTKRIGPSRRLAEQSLLRDSITQDQFFRAYASPTSEELAQDYRELWVESELPNNGSAGARTLPPRARKEHLSQEGATRPVRPRSTTSPDEDVPEVVLASNGRKTSKSHSSRKASLPQLRPLSLDKPLPSRPRSSTAATSANIEMQRINPTSPSSAQVRQPCIGRSCATSTPKPVPLRCETTFDQDQSTMPTEYANSGESMAHAISYPTLDDLFHRLLCAPQTKQEIRFMPVFLAFYRYFCPPYRLLRAILDHARSMNALTSPIVPRCGGVGRDLMLLDQWICTYPGDFARTPTREALPPFIDECRQDCVSFIVAEPIQAAMKSVAEDDDTVWINSDDAMNFDEGTQLFHGRSPSAGIRNSAESFDTALHSNLANLESSFGNIQDDASNLDSRLAFDNESSFSPISRRDSGPFDQSALSSSQTLLNATEIIQRQASLLVPSPVVSLTKVQWRALMDQPDILIARELTRMDWIMFNAIKTRDLIRHVTLPYSERSKYPGLESVNHVVDNFNHLASWASNILLLRDKPKHRALALEKIMRVARELRKCNNYNSLGALVAGTQNSAIHRLSHTRELVSERDQRDFMKLEVLMGSQKSHAAYRLAWENTTGPRIPFLPLHRRDLVVAESGNKTFIEDEDCEDGTEPRINWRKFEIMGDILMELQRARTTPYPEIIVNETVRSLILDTIITKDEDELYARSVSLEGGPTSAGALEGARVRTLTWLAKYGLSEK